MPESTPKVYFPGFNGLRFFAAFAVIITHVELLKGSFGFANAWKHPLFFNLGGLGVYFFFVLSGFLITYLLLEEKRVTNTISARKFYVRRIFRIWPLYYFILVLGFFILPHFDQLHISYLQKYFNNNYLPQLFLYMLVLPNLAFALFPAVPHIGQAWSIGVEEQFYLLWPLVIKYSRNYLKVLVILLIAVVSIKAGVWYWVRIEPDNSKLQVLKNFVAMSKFECMIVGGIGAYLLFEKKELLKKWVVNRYFHVIAWLLIPVLIFYTPNSIQDGIHLLYSVLFIVIILNISVAQKNFINLETPALNFLGKISYGIYMYHMIIIPIVLILVRKLYGNSGGQWETNILIYSMVIGLTILVSFLSFRYFESRFIRKKTKYSVIQSGEPVYNQVEQSV